MSIALVGAVLQLDLPSIRKFALLAIANNANDEGHCWPSQESIAADVGISTRALREHLQALEEDGWMTRRVGHGPGQTTVYQLDVARLKAEATSGFERRQNRKLAHENRKLATAKPEVGDMKTGSALPTEPSRTVIDPSIEPSGGADAPRVLRAKGNRPLTEGHVAGWKRRWPREPVERDVDFWRGHVGFRTATDKPAFIERKLVEKYDERRGGNGYAGRGRVAAAGAELSGGGLGMETGRVHVV